jgi:hypothetical protein
MLTCGNRKLGDKHIWSFSLPSGTPETCPGMTPTCRAHCYAVAMERYRTTAAVRYRENLRLSRGRDFARRVRAFIVAHAIRVVRVHCGGDFYAPRYARAWFRIMRRSPRVLFFFYTRSWSIPGVKRIIDRMAALPNCRAWYSVDRDTGMPTDIPPRVRLAWLATTSEDRPPANTHLVFRIRRLRSIPVADQSPPVCPTELPANGSRVVTCERCGHCWRPNPSDRMPLLLLSQGKHSADRPA